MPSPVLRGMLDTSTLQGMVDAGAVDTVLVVFPDQQGRLVGKRVTGHHFVDEVVADGIECCNYLLAVDVDMRVLPGYRFANWEKGYGDVACRPDLTTLRLVPWLDATALVVCDLLDVETGEPVEVAPRQILRRQVERAHAAGFQVMTASELEFFVFRESYEEAAAQRYADLTPQNDYVLDYHILQTTKDEYLIRAIRNGMDGAGIPIEFSKGEAEAGQHEINLRFADALTMADRHVIYKNGVKEIAAQHGQSVSFMAKYDIDRVGSSCHIHSSLWRTDGGGSAMASPTSAHQMSDIARWWLGGLMAGARELSWCFAPYVNSYKRYQPSSWAPTAVAWGIDNRTLGFRVVGRGDGRRVECRIPGADANPYYAFAATIASGLHGIEHRIEPGEPFVGNGYTATELPRVPHT
ncbi:MAG TPA: glutamine synthetase family protein, partial [Acidimicrobiales bacterium]|nr:glutamine synthetase family protein [Acidimicrobiales bacterium]